MSRSFGWFGGGGSVELSRDDPEYLQKKLYNIYKEKCVPLEHAYSFAKFNTSELSQADFVAPPLVMLLGQYSTGKTTMIEFLVGGKIPGSHTGPEPTTDKFTAIMRGDTPRSIPGHTACSDEGLPFKSLLTYGSSFLSKFEVAQLSSPLLSKMTFLDTPGVLSGKKQRGNRGYDYAAVTAHFAERADRIIVLFDCSKLDISDEFSDVLKSLDGQHDKVRCLLNKADHVGSQELFRVYGALLWSLGKVVNTPEVLRVFVGSMWDVPYRQHDDGTNETLFNRERESLLSDLHELPNDTKIRRINEMVKRFRAVKMHALLCSHLAAQFSWMGKEDTQRKMLFNLEDTYIELGKIHGVNVADFPDPDAFRRTVSDLRIKMWQWATIKPQLLETLDKEISRVVHPLIVLANEDAAPPDTVERTEKGEEELYQKIK